MISIKHLAVGLLVPMLMSLVGCSGAEGGDGFISLEIENSRAPEGFSALSISVLPSPRLAVARFRVTVTGEGIDPPITAEADSGVTEIEVLEIPPGAARSILIEAVNSDEEVIRRRRIDGVTISPGVVTPIRTSLNTIPLILNLGNGNIVQARNLKVSGFGEPGATLEVSAETKEGSILLSESAGGDPIVVSPSISSGLFDLIPGRPSVGRQTITVTDTGSGESSSVTILVLSGDDRPGRRFSPAGGLDPVISIGPGIGGPKAVHFPNILNNLGGPK